MLRINQMGFKKISLLKIKKKIEKKRIFLWTDQISENMYELKMEIQMRSHIKKMSCVEKMTLHYTQKRI